MMTILSLCWNEPLMNRDNSPEESKETIKVTAKEICNVDLPDFDIISQNLNWEEEIYRIKLYGKIEHNLPRESRVYSYEEPLRKQTWTNRLSNLFNGRENTWQQSYDYQFNNIGAVKNCRIMFSENSDTAIVEIITP